jgi:hypothetical protein
MHRGWKTLNKLEKKLIGICQRAGDKVRLSQIALSQKSDS